jgi:8-amino-7-oxononanoate synthase
VLKALDIIKEEPERIEVLWENTNYAVECLVQNGFNIGQSETPIIPLFIGEDENAFKYFTMLMANGVYVNPIIHPAVDKNNAILRFSLMATHTKKQINFAIDKLVECRRVIDNNVTVNSIQDEQHNS